MRIASLESFSRRTALKAIAVYALAFVGGQALAQADLTRLQGLLSGIPEGGWVQANLNSFSSAWPTGSVATVTANSWPAGVVRAWSGFAWDSARGDLMLWGGGHANYAGNEMYIWDSATGLWGRGSVPSRLDLNTPQNFVVDNAAPQSAHTYDNNLYLPVNDRFLTLGGNVYPLAGGFVTNINGQVQGAGPWVYDPSRADPNKVGGTTGSGWDTNSVGGNMWQNRVTMSTGGAAPVFSQGTTASRVEAGKDVVYVSTFTNGSGLPNLYRLELGDIGNGGIDSWSMFGTTNNSFMYQGAATLDNAHNFFIRTAASNSGADLAVWNFGAFNGTSYLTDVPIRLQYANGSDFVMASNAAFGIDFDQNSNQLIMWDSSEQGTVYYVSPSVDGSGRPLPVWTVTRVTSATSSQPTIPTVTGVLGKWKYVDDLDAFVALEEYNLGNGDAAVWLYKPITTAVPEVPAAVLLLTGLIAMFMLKSASSRSCNRTHEKQDGLMGVVMRAWPSA